MRISLIKLESVGLEYLMRLERMLIKIEVRVRLVRMVLNGI